jgi:hypothetical protein
MKVPGIVRIMVGNNNYNTIKSVERIPHLHQTFP